MMMSSKKNSGVQRWQLCVVALLLVTSVWFIHGVSRAERSKPVKIGVLSASWGPTPQVVGLRDGLVELGYREDVDFYLGVRFTQGDLTALSAAAYELVQQGVDILVADADESAKAVQHATTTIPIVFASVADPEGMGLIQSFARPGGNVTGVTDLDLELSAKRLEIFQEMLPGLKRLLFPYDPTDAYAMAAAQVYRHAARLLDIELVEQVMHTEAEAHAFFTRSRSDVLDGMVGPRCCSLNLPGLALQATSAWRIPTIFSTTFFVERGALASYGPDTYETGRQAARLVDKILKGAKPADLPVEVNPKIEFAINLKTAETLGVTIPPEVLFRADRVIR
jgi:putative ABC transport system substrate-binding protein